MTSLLAPNWQGLFAVVCLSFLMVVVQTALTKGRRNALPFPPGPKGKFLVGNLYDFPMSTGWITFTEWGKKYGNILYANALGQHILVLNRLEDAMELMEKRSHIYSDRPTIPMVELMGWDFNSGLMHYGERWRRHRKVYQQNFRQEASVQYQPIQRRKVHDLLRALLATPEDFFAHNQTVSIAIAMASVYGYDAAPKNDHLVSVAEEAITKGSKYVLPGAAVVNVLPILRHIPAWFPGAGFQKVAQRIKKLTLEVQNGPLAFVKNGMREGTAPVSLISRLLEDNAAGNTNLNEDDIKAIGATVYGAASDTAVSSTGTFFYAMALNPGIQSKAQAEIDRVVGIHRLPDFDDRKSLPYIEALYREVMRWRPPIPLGAPHATIEDDIYKGYFIPKGTVVFGNVWAMTRDESIYEDPERFFPDRFFNPDGTLNADDQALTFGFGRRKCVGRHMGSATVWMIITSVLATFNISKSKDESGKDMEIEDNYTDGSITHQQLFQCAVTPRSEQVRRLIDETANKD